MGTKYSSGSLAHASPAAGTEKWGVSASGVDKYLTTDDVIARITAAGKLGLLCRYKITSAVTITNSTTSIINFSVSAYDPLSLVTTGASWHFTAPATGWYDIHLTDMFTDPNGSAYTAAKGMEVDVYKNTSTFLETIAYDESDGTGGATNHWLFLPGTVAVSLTAGDTLHLEMTNFSGATRKFGNGSGIEIYRVA